MGFRACVRCSLLAKWHLQLCLKVVHLIEFRATKLVSSLHLCDWTNFLQFCPFRYDFPAEKAFIPAEVSFRPRQSGNTLHAPTKWQFVGTNDETCDEKAAWAILCEDLSGGKLLNWFLSRCTSTKDDGIQCDVGVKSVAPPSEPKPLHQLWHMG